MHLGIYLPLFSWFPCARTPNSPRSLWHAQVKGGEGREVGKGGAKGGVCDGQTNRGSGISNRDNSSVNSLKSPRAWHILFKSIFVPNSLQGEVATDGGCLTGEI